MEAEALAEEGPFNKIVSINLEKKSLRKVRLLSQLMWLKSRK